MKYGEPLLANLFQDFKGELPPGIKTLKDLEDKLNDKAVITTPNGVWKFTLDLQQMTYTPKSAPAPTMVFSFQMGTGDQKKKIKGGHLEGVP